jgi:hypothetical protein
LTAAGRKAFAKKDGFHLKPGVTKKLSEMTLMEIRRKGSWAVPFYGRARLPPLVNHAANRRDMRYPLMLGVSWCQKRPRLRGGSLPRAKSF